MKKYLITGLVIMLPVTLTIVIIVFLFNLLTTPFIGLVKAVLDHYDILDKGFLFLSADQVQRLVSQFLILTLLFLLITTLGWVARWVLFNYFVTVWNKIVNRIPIIGTVHKACQDIIKTLFTKDNNSFKQVVMVPYPTRDLFAVGLVAKDQIPHPEGREGTLTAVFVPTTPNPTSGFLMMYEESDIIYIDMRVDDALTYIVSCGMVGSPLAGDGSIDLSGYLKKGRK